MSPGFILPNSHVNCVARLSAPHHASTTSDISQHLNETATTADLVPENARFEYDTNTGVIAVNMDSTVSTAMNTTNPSGKRN